MVLGLTLSALGLLGLVGMGAKKASDSVSGASFSSAFSSNVPTEEDIIEVGKLIDSWSSEDYEADSVLSSESPQPYIDSPEITRPVLGGGGNKDDKKNGKIGFVRAFGAGYVVSEILDGFKTVAENADSLIPFLYLVFGGYVVYKVVD